MMKYLLRPGLVLLVVLFNGAAMAAPAASLTLAEVTAHPERWPAEIAVPRDLRFNGGKSVPKGRLVRVVDIEGDAVVVDAGAGLVFTLPLAECDFLARANAAWAQLTPEQRAVTPGRLPQDRDLWPLRVICFSEFTLRDGTTLKGGAEYELVACEAKGVKLYDAAHRTTLSAAYKDTDIVERARALVSVPVAERPSSIAATLRGHLVDAAGQPVDSADLEQTQVFALYFGASWCPPCRAFSPGFVQYIKSVAAANPRLSVVLLSNDKVDAQLFGYMRAENMPWPALPLSRLMLSPRLLAYSKGSIPQLVIVDRQGKILADSYRGNTYVGPQAAQRELDRILQSGAAR